MYSLLFPFPNFVNLIQKLFLFQFALAAQNHATFTFWQLKPFYKIRLPITISFKYFGCIYNYTQEVFLGLATQFQGNCILLKIEYLSEITITKVFSLRDSSLKTFVEWSELVCFSFSGVQGRKQHMLEGRGANDLSILFLNYCLVNIRLWFLFTLFTCTTCVRSKLFLGILKLHM